MKALIIYGDIFISAIYVSKIILQNEKIQLIFPLDTDASWNG